MGKCSLFALRCDVIYCGSYGKFDFCSDGYTALQLLFPFEPKRAETKSLYLIAEAVVNAACTPF